MTDSETDKVLTPNQQAWNGLGLQLSGIFSVSAVSYLCLSIAYNSASLIDNVGGALLAPIAVAGGLVLFQTGTIMREEAYGRSRGRPVNVIINDSGVVGSEFAEEEPRVLLS